MLQNKSILLPPFYPNILAKVLPVTLSASHLHAKVSVASSYSFSAAGLSSIRDHLHTLPRLQQRRDKHVEHADDKSIFAVAV